MDKPMRFRRLRKGNAQELVQELRATAVEPAVEARTRRIVRDVAAHGDEALIKYTRRFDGASLVREELRVGEREFEEAYAEVPEEVLSALKLAKDRLEAVEKAVLKKLQDGQLAQDGIQIRYAMASLESVGCYVPGGRAAYPSSLLMTATPAKVAGVPRVAVCSPPSPSKKVSPLLLVAADLCGVREFYRIGGAQAIAALAHGTESIEPVRKIVGPGGVYATAAKLAVASRVAIDLPAGPSEVLIIADNTADPRLIIRDLVCQAEHGEGGVCGLVTNSQRIVNAVYSLLPKVLKSIGRREVAAKTLASRGFVILSDDLAQAASFADAFAPEHLELLTEEPERLGGRIHSAGLILLGSYSPAAATDYCVGTNHVLPTGGFGHTYSGLSVLDYVRRYYMVRCTREGLKSIAREIEALAEAEGLPNHALAVRERFRGG